MLHRILLLALILTAWTAPSWALPPISPTATLTVTALPTRTATVTTTFGFSPYITATPDQSLSPSPSITATSTASPDQTMSSTFSPTLSVTVTLDPTDPVSPTVTQTVPAASPTPGLPIPSPLIDDYDDGDYVGYNGGLSLADVDSLGSTMGLGFVTGSDYSGSAHALHCGGSIVSQLVGPCHATLRCYFFPGGNWADILPADPTQAISFSFKADSVGVGVPIEVGLWTSGTDHYSYSFTPTDGAWHTYTVYLPSADPSFSPQLAASPGARSWANGGVQDIRSFCFNVPGASAAQSYGFAVDDLRLGEFPSQYSLVQLGAALGMPVGDVEDAYSFQLDEELTWIVIRLAAHCGCHPSHIMTLRGTMSWGQIAASLGTTWTAVLAEVDASGLANPTLNVAGMERGLYNGPLPPPGPQAQFYVPTSAYALPTPTGGCQ
jgi:hypothetical protein